MTKCNRQEIHGVIAEFDSPSRLLAAARAAHERGYRAMDAYAPFPVEGLAEAIGFRKNRVRALLPRRRDVRRRRRLFHAVVCDGDRLSFERRRSAAAQHSRVHPDHFRADDSVRGLWRQFSECSRSTACRARIIRSSTRRISSVRAPTDFSSASRLAIRFNRDAVMRISARASIPTASRRYAKRSAPFSSQRGSPALMPRAARTCIISRAPSRSGRSDVFPGWPNGATAPAAYGCPRCARGVDAGIHREKRRRHARGRFAHRTRHAPCSSAAASVSISICAVCHDRTGEGNGMIVQRGFPPPPCFHHGPAARRAHRPFLSMSSPMATA